MPRNPTLRALVHACTISFGSVCLGSLFVAIIQTLHAIVNFLGHMHACTLFFRSMKIWLNCEL
jgi:hypothetical protein